MFVYVVVSYEILLRLNFYTLCFYVIQVSCKYVFHSEINFNTSVYSSLCLDCVILCDMTNEN